MKKNQTPDETTGKKVIAWVKEKRFYIVLLCCIMSVSATYFIAASVKPTQSSADKIAKAVPTPIPNSSANIAPVETPTPILPTITPEVDTSTPKPSIAPSRTAEPETSTIDASADTEVEYAPRAKMTLSYPTNGKIITPHTTETLVYSKTLGDWRTHCGIDIKSDHGAEVKAADDGIVESVYTDDFMGITIVLDHQNGRKTTYSNLSNSGLVAVGQTVKRGDVISTVGSSAIAESGEEGHLHFEVADDGETIDPFTVLEN